MTLNLVWFCVCVWGGRLFVFVCLFVLVRGGFIIGPSHGEDGRGHRLQLNKVLGWRSCRGLLCGTCCPPRGCPDLTLHLKPLSSRRSLLLLPPDHTPATGETENSSTISCAGITFMPGFPQACLLGLKDPCWRLKNKKKKKSSPHPLFLSFQSCFPQS